MSLQSFSIRWLGLLFISVWLTACSDDAGPGAVNEVLGPVAFESGDECHVCGMIITELPGAKAQVRESRNANTHKFCSTQDMLSWWLQPENKNLQAEIYVHDVALTPWASPLDEHLIDARSAWYVIGSSLTGAMGPSLVSYSERDAAQALVDAKGGRMLSWEDLNLDILRELASAGHEHAAEHGEHLRHQHGVVEPENSHHDSH